MEAVAEITLAETGGMAARNGNAARIEELGRIIQAYSEVTEKLQRSHAQLQQTVQSLQNELSEKNRQLERKERLAALGEMAAGMAHEIRNPLGGIQLYASMLAKDVCHQPEPLQLVGKISAGVKRLEGVVSQVLQFAREITANRVETDVAGLVEQAVELAGCRPTAARIVCRVSGPRPLMARVDPLLMGQAVLNLLINAMEAIEGKGSIDIVCSGRGAAGCRISIRDSGPGIPPAMLERIFNPFYTTKESGTGLGLAIVHRIVEAHDGTITAANSPDGGAVFEVVI